MAQGPLAETDVVLRDGRTVRVRPARFADRDAIEDYLIGLSAESRRLRFWGSSIDVRDVAARAVDVDGENHVTLLATPGDEGRVVGGAQLFREGSSTRAEVSFSVADELQKLGLGSIMVGLLADAATRIGIDRFFAHVLPENHRMISVFRDSGFHVSIIAKPGVVEVEFPIAITKETIEQFEDRERLAGANAVRAFFEARSIAVIGASRDPASIGGRLFHNLVAAPFSGAVYPVNPSAPSIQGVTSYPSIDAIPGAVDLAFIAVPARGVLDAASACGAKGVRGLVVISAGFGETDDEGRARQHELLARCRASGMRLIGPNCMGIVNTDPEVRLNGTFGTAEPPVGRVAFMSQSGALGLAVMNRAAALGLGLSTFVSVGNKADISGNDLLCFWEDDPRTDVVLLYMESFGNPRRFARLARRIGRTKPIIAVKSGRSAAGHRATSSHTGALLATSDSAVDALFRQHGVIRTDTLEEMFDIATLVANQPVPEGRRVAIVTNAGGLAIQCADTCAANGLEVPQLSDETQAALREFLPDSAGVTNPVDMIASATGEDYGRAIATLGADPGIDALIVIYIPPIEAGAADVARHLVDGIEGLGRRIPVLSCFMSARGLPEALRAPGVRIPSFTFPEQAAIALARAAEHGAWRAAPSGSIPELPDVRIDEAAAVLAEALAGGEGWLGAEALARLFDCYGIPLVKQRLVADAAQAQAAAIEMGGTVALKAMGPVHKTEAGAVRLDVAPTEVEQAAVSMAADLGDHGERLDGFLIQQMVPRGVEMLVGAVSDPSFGPVVAVGAGGTAVELIRDVSVRIAPITDVDADSMVHSLKTFPLLDGFRGAPPADVEALVDVVLRVGAMADRHPAIAEMDCNPVVVLEHGVAVVDARVRVRPPAPEEPLTGWTAG